ncbi:MAG TPA: PBP1A family penicillin-binding protein [Blastocatellia bacterium]|nr:PBP1A family penicillin-binding protein [Blastocatellia bacterium]
MPTQRRSSSGARTHRHSSPSLLRRFFGFLFSRYTLVPLFLLMLVGAGVLYYYYERYTAIIDNGLSGDLFVRTSGIYAAPRQIRSGSSLKAADVVVQLKRIGYLERGATKNEKRGQYALRGNVLEIQPGSDAVIDGERAFRSLRVNFGGNGIQSISDTKSGEQLSVAELEPEMISSVLGEGREKRKNIEFKDLPEHLVEAIYVIEDQQFFEHYGVNWRGIIRAFIRNQEEGRITGGGSSITSQLVKNLFLTKEQTYKRKMSEAFISVLLEQRLTKEQIFAMYCNIAYLGQRSGFSINGFGEAARSYFDKDISQLTLAESCMLAGIIRSPNYYAPFKHPERAEERRNVVINEMLRLGKITEAEAERAKATPLGLKGSGGGRLDISEAPYFVDYLTKQVERNYDDGTGSKNTLRVYSTIDLDLQRAAYQAVTKQMNGLEKIFAKRKGGTQGLQTALVAMNAKTGEVLAMIGGKDYQASQFNRATEAKRQPGSVFKPFVYAAAINTAEYGGDVITPATILMDEPKTFTYGFGDEYTPNNYGDTFSHKPITVRDALVYSKNVVTVELAERVGFSEIARLAEKAGLPRPPTYPSMALGVAEATPLQIASAYTMFANKGRRVAPTAIKRVTNASGNTVDTPTKDSRVVLSPQVAYVMTSMMQDVLNRGTGARVRQMGFKATAAGKTGSSRDGWFAGYTPNLVCAVYVGFDDNSDLRMTGGEAAAPIWADFMSRALALHPDLGGEFEDPGGIMTVDIDPATGMIAKNGGTNLRHELFIEGTEPNRKEPENGDPIDPDTTPDSQAAPDSGDRPSSRPRQVTQQLDDVTLRNTIVFEVCTDTGLIPTENLCTRMVRRRYKLGQEPYQFCTKAAHQKRGL